MNSRVISLSEKGLNLDTLNSKSEYIRSKMYAYKNETIVYAKDDNVLQYDLKQDKIVHTYKIDKVKSIKLCDCGLHCCIHTADKSLYFLFGGDAKIIATNVDSADVSCTFAVIVKLTDIQIIEHDKTITVFDYKNVKDFVVSGSLLFFITRKTQENKNKLVCYDPAQKKQKSFDFDNIEKFAVKSSADNKHFLVSVTTEYSKESYFGCLKLFYFDRQNLKEVAIQQPLLYYNFVSNGFLLCYGPQPSKVVVLNYLLEHKKSFPLGIRNAAYINNHGSMIGFTGFGNLSGEVEIYSTKLLCKIKVLGASVFNWSPCGTYFMIGTTNELKVDNKIAIYDYYGRMTKELHFDNLESCMWIGAKQPFAKLDEPQALNVIEEVAYVPPHLRQEKHKSKPKKAPAKVKTKAKEKQETTQEESVEELQQKMQEINDLKAKIRDGITLSVEEYNKVLNETEIQQKIQKASQ